MWEEGGRDRERQNLTIFLSLWRWHQSVSLQHHYLTLKDPWDTECHLRSDLVVGKWTVPYNILLIKKKLNLLTTNIERKRRYINYLRLFGIHYNWMCRDFKLTVTYWMNTIFSNEEAESFKIFIIFFKIFTNFPCL